MRFDGFDWDDGNWPKCAQHGLSRPGIEAVFRNGPLTDADPSTMEQRFRAVGRNDEGRYVFVVYVIRIRDGLKLLRPISARFMHTKEIKRYEQAKA